MCGVVLGGDEWVMMEKVMVMVLLKKKKVMVELVDVLIWLGVLGGGEKKYEVVDGDDADEASGV